MIDLSYLRVTTNDDKELIAQLIGIFTNQLPEFEQDIKLSFNSKNWDSLMQASHKAKNSFEMMGIKDQALELKRIELLAVEAKECQELDTLIENFFRTSKLVREEIKNLQI
jgi:HPt (histidine-containing phosphotransfer) domain-containing protein